VQALGGTGGLKLGADFLKKVEPGALVLISDPSWENHRALFANAGFEVGIYPYYDAATRGIRFDAMLGALRAAARGTIVVLHACCHNPTGCDLTPAQWDALIPVLRERELLPYLDLAYQGFGDGIDADGAVVRRFAQAMSPVFVASSFSKSFSLYGERAGALSILTASPDEAARVLSQLKRVVRANYSNPPTHGGQVVTTVLTTPELRALWQKELGAMRERIKAMRKALVESIHASAPGADFGFIATLAAEVVIFGTGPAQRFPARELARALAAYGTGIEFMDNGAACRTYNILAADGRGVVAPILLPG